MAGFSAQGGQQQAQQKTQSYSGLSGTSYFKPAAGSAYQASQQVSDLTNQFIGNIRTNPQNWMNTGRAILPGGKYGLGENSENAVAMLGQDLFSRGSADAGARGQLSPENRNAVVGSALQNASIQLIPQMMAFQQAQFMAPQSLQQVAINNADLWARLLGTRSQGQGSSSGSSYGFGGHVVSAG